MEIDINNAFSIAIKTTYEPCLVKYHEITETTLNISQIILNYFLRKPFLTTILFSAFILIVMTALSIIFIIILGVFIFVLIILLIEGFILITFSVTLCMILLNLVLITIVIIEIKCKLLTPT